MSGALAIQIATPSIHMLRAASRIDLEVTGVRVERLQEPTGSQLMYPVMMKRTAQISPCGAFRYRLGRAWTEDGFRKPLVFVMLNPSTADADQDDATIRRCVHFAQAHGFGAIDVVNLFAFRATKPEDLRRAGYQVGPDNDQHIAEAVRRSGATCVAWGSTVAGLERPQIVLPLIRAELGGNEPKCLRITRSGYPQHPLMLPSSCRLMPFSAEAIQAAMAATTLRASRAERG